MKTLRLAATLLWCLLLPALAAPDGFVWINVSVKLIRFPGDGGRPRTNRNLPGSAITDAQIQTALDDANAFLASYQRGYRIRIVETLEIGGLGQDQTTRTRLQPGYYAYQSTAANPLTFSYPPGYTDPNGTVRTTGPLIDVLDQNARSSTLAKAAFQWNDNALNIFVPTEWGGGGGIFPGWGDAAGFGFFEGWLFLHELGHYFGLYHTFDDDVVDDTLIDPVASGRNAVAYALFGTAYAPLTASLKTAVDKDSGNDYRAVTIYNKLYSALTVAEKSVVDNLPGASDWAQVLYNKTYSQLTAEEKKEVDDRVANPPYTSQDHQALSYRTYAKSYASLTNTERTVVRALYDTRSRNSIAAANGLGNSYAILSPFNQDRVDNLFFNIMSYYDAYERNTFVTRMTEGQADRFTDACNNSRKHVTSGYTRFVSPAGTDALLFAQNNATNPALPGRTITHALARAALTPGDDEIILAAPGQYNETGTFSTPGTLRATRKGPVVIGRP